MPTLSDFFKPLTATKKDRLNAVCFVKKHPELLPDLFQLAFSSKAMKKNRYAAWVVELLVLEDLNRLTPFLDLCVGAMPSISNSSMRRAISKCLWNYFKENNSRNLTLNQKEQLVNASLDWVLTEQKTAPLSFTIKLLALFFDDIAGLRNQLKGILIDSNRVFPKGLYPTFRIVFNN